MCTARLTLNNSTFCPTQCIYVFCVDLRTNSDYFSIQHSGKECLLRGMKLVFKKTDTVSSLRVNKVYILCADMCPEIDILVVFMLKVMTFITAKLSS